ncbi:RagB/SusD family nutrient uptake outer membrane protein [Flavihumibacter petaseus]|uniref:RagB/SusD domain-containing protein n=1 Tax=Flavihumibacter petaseus NBRC 106054 TaxID=1220578 RepID=A0A0E9MY87_9BACT|nr:RagB/SusD family nutrient uptake outer membrane protein [Flavihumibacter petaseus]GAO42554.1 hypothetical protein FPE01S_01_15690 [Flavihumibacter petaseus NBRC 106054]
MKHNMLLKIALLLLGSVMFLGACKKEYGNLNSPTVEDFLKDATQSQLNNLVSGTESGMRNEITLYLDDVATIGREGYRFSGSEPRYVTDLLGANEAQLTNNAFYTTNPWAARYRVIKNCDVLEASANRSTQITAEQKKGYSGFAKTIRAYQLLLALNLTYQNGIRVDVSDPNNLGPIVSYDNGLAAIISLLDAGKTDLTGATVSFPLSSGFSGFNDAAGLIKFNRALAARVALYQKNYTASLSNLNESFFDLNGDLNTGVTHEYSTGSGDQLNGMFIPQNQNGEIRPAHPSFATDIVPGDDRISKATLRTSTASLQGLSSNRDVWVYTSSTASLPMIRNEELILIYAESKIQQNALPDAIVALNVIRGKHNMTPYAGGVTQSALLNELLYQRRYSLFYEGHRWIDLRRYDRTNELPKDRTDDDIWIQFPLPNTEG